MPKVVIDKLPARMSGSRLAGIPLGTEFHWVQSFVCIGGSWQCPIYMAYTNDSSNVNGLVKAPKMGQSLVTTEAVHTGVSG